MINRINLIYSNKMRWLYTNLLFMVKKKASTISEIFTADRKKKQLLLPHSITPPTLTLRPPQNRKYSPGHFRIQSWRLILRLTIETALSLD